MSILQCERCGADLPPTPPGQTVTCGYCGAVQVVSSSPSRAPMEVDLGRMHKVFDYLVRTVRRESGVDVAHDPAAALRVREAAARAVSEMDRDGAADVSLPFLTATPRGPVHLSTRVTPDALERVDAPPPPDNPFAPEESVRARQIAEELGTQDARMAAMRARYGVPEERPASRSSLFGCAIAVALVAVGGVIAYFAVTSDGDGDGTTAPTVASVVPPKTIADVDRDDAWVTLPAQGMPGTFDRFDPIAGLPWAVGMARQWSPDAQLDSLYVSRVRMDGTVDAGARGDHPHGAEPNVDYRFVSLSRRQRAQQRITVADNDVRSAFRIEVHDGELEAMSSTEGATDLDDEIGQVFPEGCPLSQMLAAMRAAGLPPRPAYDLTATWSQGAWTWWIDETDIENTPRVDVATCAVTR